MTQQADFDQWAERLKVLSSSVRLEILQLLRTGPRTVCELSDALQLPVISTSHHLQILYRERLVVRKRQGRSVVYRLPKDLFKLVPEERNIEILDLGCCRIVFPIDHSADHTVPQLLASVLVNEYSDVH